MYICWYNNKGGVSFALDFFSFVSFFLFFFSSFVSFSVFQCNACIEDVCHDDENEMTSKMMFLLFKCVSIFPYGRTNVYISLHLAQVWLMYQLQKQ